MIATITPNTLPLTPEITPGLGIAGIILILTGAAYTLIGVKDRRIHVSLSAAYLSSLAVTVLIIYVMNPPVSNAVQGAYVVAATLTGAILGGAALVFPELTEGLGCLLGGFCVSMWFLVLKSGGLITSTGGRTAFIIILTVAGFALSFIHYIRSYALMSLISFSGATVIVLGVDCFSKAGLKEFWAYIWNLNDDLFSDGTTTYPITRGIRVEIAAIIILCCAGIASQLKLWQVIKERRTQQLSQEQEKARALEKEEVNVGRQVEAVNSAERGEWEAVYGQKATGVISKTDSVIGDFESKRSPQSTITSTRRSGDEITEVYELDAMSEAQANSLLASNQIKNRDAVAQGNNTTRPAKESQRGQIGKKDFGSLAVSPKPAMVIEGYSRDSTDGTATVVGSDTDMSKNMSRQTSTKSVRIVPPPPKVVPMPFTVPQEDGDDRSSVATYNDEPEPRRASRRLSTGTILVQTLSQEKSPRSSRRVSRRASAGSELVPAPRDMEDDKRSSMAATLDELSDDEEYSRKIEKWTSVSSSTQENMDVNIDTEGQNAGTGEGQSAEKASGAEEEGENGEAPKERAELKEDTDMPQKQQFLPLVSESKAETQTTEGSTEAEAEDTTLPSLKDRLPRTVSKAVKTYRTHEWAKHVDNADEPEIQEPILEEELSLPEKSVKERAVPVNMKALQQTPTNAPIAPAPRAITQTPPKPTISRSASNTSSFSRSSAGKSPQNRSLQSSPQPYSSPLSSPQQPSSPNLTAKTRGYIRSSSSPILSPHSPQIPSPARSPNLTPGPLYASANTLLAKRETLIRNKSSNFGNTPLSPARETAPIHDYGRRSTESNDRDEDSMSMMARREMIHQASLTALTGNAPSPPQLYRQASQGPLQREAQLASWRASVQQDLKKSLPPQQALERQRSVLLEQQNRQKELTVSYEEKRRQTRESAMDEMMRKGNLAELHREALRKMQAEANKTLRNDF
jgi:hypothetical protein